MAPLTEPAFARLRSVDPVLAEAAGDAAFELETDLFAALAKGIMEKGASDAFPFAWASLAAQIGEVSPERVLEAGSALEAFGKKTANALLGAAKAVRSGKIGMERLAMKAETVAAWRGGKPKLLIVAPPHIGAGHNDPAMGASCHATSMGVAEEYRRRCEAHGWAFLDAEGVAEFNTVDYMHLGRRGHRQLADALAPVVRELT